MFGNLQVFKNNLVKNVQFRYGTTGKFFFLRPSSSPSPRRQNFRENFFRYPFQYPKVPLEAVPPPPISRCFLRPCVVIWENAYHGNGGLIFFKRGLVQSYTMICRLSGGCHANQTNPAFIKESPCLNLFIIKTHSLFFLVHLKNIGV